MEDDQSFRLEEYKTLRKEIELYLTESRLLERNTVIAVGAIWAWLIVNHQTHALLWAIPIILTTASVGTTLAVNAHFKHLGSYIRTLEATFNVKGWEHVEKPRTIGLSSMILSGALLVLAMVGFVMRGSLA